MVQQKPLSEILPKYGIQVPQQAADSAPAVAPAAASVPQGTGGRVDPLAVLRKYQNPDPIGYSFEFEDAPRQPFRRLPPLGRDSPEAIARREAEEARYQEALRTPTLFDKMDRFKRLATQAAIGVHGNNPITGGLASGFFRRRLAESPDRAEIMRSVSALDQVRTWAGVKPSEEMLEQNPPLKALWTAAESDAAVLESEAAMNREKTFSSRLAHDVGGFGQFALNLMGLKKAGVNIPSSPVATSAALMGAHEAIRGAPQGLEEMAKGAGKGAAMGAALGAVGKVTGPVAERLVPGPGRLAAATRGFVEQAPVGAALGAMEGDSAGAGAAAGGLTFGLFGAMGARALGGSRAARSRPIDREVEADVSAQTDPRGPLSPETKLLAADRRLLPTPKADQARARLAEALRGTKGGEVMEGLPPYGPIPEPGRSKASVRAHLEAERLARSRLKMEMGEMVRKMRAAQEAQERPVVGPDPHEVLEVDRYGVVSPRREPLGFRRPDIYQPPRPVEGSEFLPPAVISGQGPVQPPLGAAREAHGAFVLPGDQRIPFAPTGAVARPWEPPQMPWLAKPRPPVAISDRGPPVQVAPEGGAIASPPPGSEGFGSGPSVTVAPGRDGPLEAPPATAPEPGPPAASMAKTEPRPAADVVAHREITDRSEETGEAIAYREEWRARKVTPAIHEELRERGDRTQNLGPFILEKRTITRRGGGESVPRDWRLMTTGKSVSRVLEGIPDAAISSSKELDAVRDKEAARVAKKKAEADAVAKEAAHRQTEYRKRAGTVEEVLAGQKAFERLSKSKSRVWAERWNAYTKAKIADTSFVKKAWDDPDFMRDYRAAAHATTIPSKVKNIKEFLAKHGPEFMDWQPRKGPGPAGSGKGGAGGSGAVGPLGFGPKKIWRIFAEPGEAQAEFSRAYVDAQKSIAKTIEKASPRLREKLGLETGDVLLRELEQHVKTELGKASKLWVDLKGALSALPKNEEVAFWKGIDKNAPLPSDHPLKDLERRFNQFTKEVGDAMVRAKVLPRESVEAHRKPGESGYAVRVPGRSKADPRTGRRLTFWAKSILDEIKNQGWTVHGLSRLAQDIKGPLSARVKKRHPYTTEEVMRHRIHMKDGRVISADVTKIGKDRIYTKTNKEGYAWADVKRVSPPYKIGALPLLRTIESEGPIGAAFSTFEVVVNDARYKHHWREPVVGEDPPEGFVRIPDTDKSFGVLAGKEVSKNLYHTLRPLTNRGKPEFLEFLLTINAAAKEGVTIDRFPGYQVKQPLDNAMMLWIGGLGPEHLPLRLKQAAGAMRAMKAGKIDKYLGEMIEMQVFGRQPHTQDVEAGAAPWSREAIFHEGVKARGPISYPLDWAKFSVEHFLDLVRKAERRSLDVRGQPLGLFGYLTAAVSATRDSFRGFNPARALGIKAGPISGEGLRAWVGAVDDMSRYAFYRHLRETGGQSGLRALLTKARVMKPAKGMAKEEAAFELEQLTDPKSVKGVPGAISTVSFIRFPYMAARKIFLQGGLATHPIGSMMALATAALVTQASVAAIRWALDKSGLSISDEEIERQTDQVTYGDELRKATTAVAGYDVDKDGKVHLHFVDLIAVTLADFVKGGFIPGKNVAYIPNESGFQRFLRGAAAENPAATIAWRLVHEQDPLSGMDTGRMTIQKLTSEALTPLVPGMKTLAQIISGQESIERAREGGREPISGAKEMVWRALTGMARYRGQPSDSAAGRAQQDLIDSIRAREEMVKSGGEFMSIMRKPEYPGPDASEEDLEIYERQLNAYEQQRGGGRGRSRSRRLR